MKFSDSPYFIIDEFFSSIVNDITYESPTLDNIVDNGYELYVKTSDQFIRCKYIPLSTHVVGDYFKVFITVDSPSGSSFDSDDEVYFKKESEFYDYVNDNDLTDFINTNKTFTYIGKLYETNDDNTYNIYFNGIKNYALNALPQNNRTTKMEELLNVYFDKIYNEIYNKQKNIWTLHDPKEIDINYLNYLSRMYNVDITSSNPLSNDRLREYVKDLIYWLKRKGTYSSIYIIWLIIVRETLNQLNVYERWHDWNSTLNLNTFEDTLYTNFTDYSVSTSDYPAYSEYTEGDKYLSTHYKVEIDLSYEPFGDDYIINEPIIRALIDTWETTRPVTKVSHYQELFRPDVNFSGDYIDLYDDTYTGYYKTKSCIVPEKPYNVYVHYQSDPSIGWNIFHRFVNKYVLVQFYDLDLKQIKPKTVRYMGENLTVDIISDTDTKEFTSGYGDWDFSNVTTSIVDSTTKTGINTTSLNASSSACLKMDIDEDGGYAKLYLNTIEGNCYHFRFLHYIDNYNYLYVGSSSSDNINAVDNWKSFYQPEGWNDSVFTFSPPSGGSYLFVKGDKSSDVIYLDNIRCYESNSPTYIYAEFDSAQSGYAFVSDRESIHTQSSGSNEWTVDPSLSERLIISQFIDTSNEKVSPYEVEYVSDSESKITFDDPIEGYMVMHSGSYTFTQPTSATVWNIEHNLNQIGCIVQTYDEDYKRIYPAELELVDKDNIKITFDDPIKGYVRLIRLGNILDQFSSELISYVKFGNQGDESFDPVEENDIQSDVLHTETDIQITSDNEYTYISVIVRDKIELEFTEVGFFDPSDNLIFYTRNSSVYKPEDAYVKIILKVTLHRGEEEEDSPCLIGITPDPEIIVPEDSPFAATFYETGYIYGWGCNDFGQIGNNSVNAVNIPTLVGNDVWAEISNGYYFTTAITDDSKLYSWGRNNYGQLGKGDTNDISTPTLISGTYNWEKVSNGAYHALALNTFKKLYAWGRNNYGQLGKDDISDRSRPTQIGTDTDWESIACGEYHSLAIKTDGSLYAWGYNTNGQLGQDNTNNISSPTQVGTDTDWESIDCGISHSISLNSSGELYAWGSNTNGQLGQDDIVNRSTPTIVDEGKIWIKISCGGNNSLSIDDDDTLYSWGNNNDGQLGQDDIVNRSTPTQIGSDRDWEEIASGYETSLALKTDETLYSWGNNDTYQLGVGDTTNRSAPTQIKIDKYWHKIVGGYCHCFAIENDNYEEQYTGQYLLSWGCNDYGQLGLSNIIGSSNPTVVGSDNNWKRISSGTNHSLMIKYNGTLWSMGRNNYGQLGQNNLVNRSTPVQIENVNIWYKIACGEYHSLALRENNTLYAWGRNNYGQLGRNNTTNVSRPTQVGSNEDWVDVGCGYNHSLAVKSDGTLYSWGYNNEDQLGHGDGIDKSTPTQVGSATNWNKSIGGEYHSLGIKLNGEIWAWGSNSNGQLGQDNIVNRSTPTQVGSNIDWNLIDCGKNHSLATKLDNILYAWGSNSNGQLGQDDVIDISTPTQIGSDNWIKISGNDNKSIAIKDDNTLYSWGDYIGSDISTPTQIGTNSTWTDVKLGYCHMLGLNYNILYSDTPSYIYTWGCNEYGQLGNNNIINKSQPTQVGSDKYWYSIGSGYYHTSATNEDYKIYSWGKNDYGQLGLNDRVLRSIPTQIGSSTDWLKTNSGEDFTVSIKTDYSLYSWGRNDYGQLGIGNTNNSSVPTQVGTDTDWTDIICGEYHSLSINTSGELYAWGRNNYGQLGQDNIVNRSTPTQVGSATDWSKIACDNNFSLSINTSGELYAWGNNLYGQLGQNDIVDISTPTQVGSATDWIEVACGEYYTVAINTSNELYAWGRNVYGQLGQNNIINKSTPTQVGSDTDWSEVACGRRHTLIIKTDGSLYITGFNENGQLGLGTVIYASTPTQVGTDTDWSDINGGYCYSAATKENIYEEITVTDGTIWSCGKNNYGQLGTGDIISQLNFVKIGSSNTWSEIACGEDHSLAIKTNGTLWSWGKNFRGSLGHNVYYGGHRSIPIQVGSDTDWSKISRIPDIFSLALKTDGSLYSCGYNNYGQLGTGDRNPRSTPIQIGTDTDWSEIASGDEFSLALKTDGSLYSWGYNNCGQLGIGNKTNKSTPTQVGSDTDWESITCGIYNSYAIKTDGSLYSWGYGLTGRLGHNDKVSRSTPTQVGSDTDWEKISSECSTCYALKTDGSLYSWGYNKYGQLGTGNRIYRSTPTQVGSDTDWSEVRSGSSHVIALKSDGTLYSWGRNDDGQLSQGDKVDRSTPTQVGTDTDWSEIFCGNWHNIALKRENS